MDRQAVPTELDENGYNVISNTEYDKHLLDFQKWRSYRQVILKELDENGYCVIPNVISPTECDEYLLDFQKWHANFKESGKSLHQRKSIIQSYRIGHFESAWKCRLKCKPVFELLWDTDKLLTSVDGVALANPPEKGDGDFREPGAFWLHLDQGVKRQGRHAYQGAVYLEETTAEDYCFRVLKHSHKHHSDFFGTFPKAAAITRKFEFLKLKPAQRHWYMDNGCPLVYVPVPKGGMVLWDSRTVHDTAPPECGRQDSDKWRCVVFVSMTPAKWAGDDDIKFKQKVYYEMQLTSHWSSQGQKTFTNYSSKKRKIDGKMVDPLSIDALPPIAKTAEVKMLMGVEKYNFSDSKSNGPPSPFWIR